MKKQLLFVRFRIQGEEKQEIHFTNANTNNKKVQVPYYDMWKLPKIALKTLSKLFLRDLPKCIEKALVFVRLFYKTVVCQ